MLISFDMCRLDQEQNCKVFVLTGFGNEAKTHQDWGSAKEGEHIGTYARVMCENLIPDALKAFSGCSGDVV